MSLADAKEFDANPIHPISISFLQVRLMLANNLFASKCRHTKATNIDKTNKDLIFGRCQKIHNYSQSFEKISKICRTRILFPSGSGRGICLITLRVTNLTFVVSQKHDTHKVRKIPDMMRQDIKAAIRNLDPGPDPGTGFALYFHPQSFCAMEKNVYSRTQEVGITPEVAHIYILAPHSCSICLVSGPEIDIAWALPSWNERKNDQ